MATTTRTTTARLKKQLKEAGVRLPHGYEVVPRKPAKKKKKTASKATAKKRVASKTPAKKRVARQTSLF